MSVSTRVVLRDLIENLSDELRATLTSTQTTPQASMDTFLEQARILLKAFEDAATAGESSQQRRTYAIRNLGMDIEAHYESAKTYLSRLQAIHGDRAK